MNKPMQKNYDLSTIKGRAKYTVDMLNYRKYIKVKKAEKEARSFEIDGMKAIFKRMNDPKRRFVQW